ncbi:hypothetical protein BFP76_13780 [Amylibacter kogurei]|uniref:Haloacid dehalogenase n=1 Tax=Paramylibacter kogurei TaxID=1889778 RepID=A0A2G5K9C5_9RHOB|nr:HAD family phosphatase [Amylibacter kogurei]PIB26035.1 hypothetical protein BFP76_13780 [Amylibacter kogurei]
MQPKLVIFDCDGVLVDSEPATIAVLSQNIARYGIHMSEAECTQTFLGRTMSVIQTTLRDMGAELPDDWVAQIYAEIYAKLADTVEEIPGIKLVLDDLVAKGIPFCVGSNGSREKMGITLGRTDLMRYFDGNIYSAHEIGVGKPDPTMYLTAALQFGVDPADCLVIEDSPSGAEAAKRAGMPCYGFIRETPRERMEPWCHIVFDDMAKLPQLIAER